MRKRRNDIMTRCNRDYHKMKMASAARLGYRKTEFERYLVKRVKRGDKFEEVFKETFW